MEQPFVARPARHRRRGLLRTALLTAVLTAVMTAAVLVAASASRADAPREITCCALSDTCITG